MMMHNTYKYKTCSYHHPRLTQTNPPNAQCPPQPTITRKPQLSFITFIILNANTSLAGEHISRACGLSKSMGDFSHVSLVLVEKGAKRRFFMRVIRFLCRCMQLSQARRHCLCAAPSLHADGKCAIVQHQRHRQHCLF